MKVSIILPVYNAEKWLAACLDSLLAQTEGDFEIIAINDGSKDGSGRILSYYAQLDDCVRVFTTENHGVSAARNLGLDNARGEYVRFVDSDDALAPDSLALLTQAMEAGQAQLVIGAFDEVTPRIRRTHRLQEQDEHIDQSTYLRRLRRYPKSFYYSALWNKLYRLDVIRRYGIRFDEKLNWSEDFVFNMAYLTHVQRVAVLASSVYDYHHHCAGLTGRNAKESILHPLRVWRLNARLFSLYRSLYAAPHQEKPSNLSLCVSFMRLTLGS